MPTNFSFYIDAVSHKDSPRCLKASYTALLPLVLYASVVCIYASLYYTHTHKHHLHLSFFIFFYWLVLISVFSLALRCVLRIFFFTVASSNATKCTLKQPLYKNDVYILIRLFIRFVFLLFFGHRKCLVCVSQRHT